VFGGVYLAAALGLGIGEASGLLRRVRRLAR
jgi:hypothetical protein